MNPQPLKLELTDDDQLSIEWTDGQRRRYRFHELRDACPCATCRGKRNEPQPLLPVLSASEAQPMKVVGMRPVGNYAYTIAFSDGHDTGIFSYELLRALGEQVA